MSLKLSKKNIKANRGITLIALVITIIVLLILAGVAIATLTGDNGLITKTTDARKSNIVGTEKEKIGLAYNEYIIKKYSETNPQLNVEGAVTELNGNKGWKISFNETKNKYELSLDGKTIKEGKQPITFKIEGESYQVEEGMTWQEWVESSYNIGNIFEIRDEYVWMNENEIVGYNHGGMVLPEEVIRG